MYDGRTISVEMSRTFSKDRRIAFRSHLDTVTVCRKITMHNLLAKLMHYTAGEI